MAKDVLALWLCDLEDADQPIPVPTASSEIAHQEKGIVALISCNTTTYRHLTSLAIEEGRHLVHDPNAKRYRTMDELKNALLEE